MNNDIKEMINEIKETVDGYLETYKLKDDMMYDTINYKASQWYKLLDYITNLQNKITDLEDTIIDKHECIEAQNDTITNLQEENKQLKELTKDKSYCEDCEFKKDNEIYKDIIDKAIEYITSYESISTIQGLDKIEQNKKLDERTINVIVERYLKVHHKLLNILQRRR